MRVENIHWPTCVLIHSVIHSFSHSAESSHSSNAFFRRSVVRLGLVYSLAFSFVSVPPPHPTPPPAPGRALHEGRDRVWSTHPAPPVPRTALVLANGWLDAF